jgi:hypothetical protein
MRIPCSSYQIFCTELQNSIILNKRLRVKHSPTPTLSEEKDNDDTFTELIAEVTKDIIVARIARIETTKLLLSYHNIPSTTCSTGMQ